VGGPYSYLDGLEGARGGGPVLGPMVLGGPQWGASWVSQGPQKGPMGGPYGYLDGLKGARGGGPVLGPIVSSGPEWGGPVVI
jgi:hypothetical protein